MGCKKLAWPKFHSIMRRQNSSIIVCALAGAFITTDISSARQTTIPSASTHEPLTNWTAKEDHQNMMEQLGIKTLRPGADGNNPKAPNYQNTDESKANPYFPLPDPLTLKNGEKVTTPEMWWNRRRPEIVEDFDREVYGRVPANPPKVTWEATSVIHTNNGSIPVTKQLTAMWTTPLSGHQG